MSFIRSFFSKFLLPFFPKGVTREESSFKNPILVDIGGIKDKNNNEIVRNYNGVIAGELTINHDSLDNQGQNLCQGALQYDF